MRAKEWKRGVLTTILALVAVWLGTLIWGLVGKAHLAVSQAHDAQAQYEALEGRKSALEDDLAALASPRGEDAAIRTAFGVARPGEEVIVVVPPVATTTPAPLSWWEKVLHWFR
jgi:cell division protein FtsB